MTTPDTAHVKEEGDDEVQKDARMLPELQRAVHDEVRELVDEGRVRAAERVLVEALEDALPELPLRFGLRLVKIDRRQFQDFSIAMQSCGRAPALIVRNKKSRGYSVEWINGTLGWLGAEDVERLRAFGERAAWYTPRLMEIYGGVDEKPEGGRRAGIVIELARQEMRVCSGCGKLHAGVNINCDSCRSLRKRKGDPGTTLEPAPVALTRALEYLAQDTRDDGAESDS